MKSRPRVRRRQFLCTLGATGGSLLAGCSESTDETPPPTATDETTPAGTPVGTEPPEQTDSPEPGLSVPGEALMDEPVRIAVTGVDPGDEVMIRAIQRYPQDGRYSGQFESFAVFEADGNGRVDLPERAPLDGTYESADGMGLFWSMYPRSELAKPDDATLDSPTVDGLGRTVHFRATVGGEEIAATQTRRQTRTEDVETREAGDGLVGRLFLPTGAGPHPGAILLHGGTPALPVEPAGVLASRRVATLALKWLGPEEELSDRPIHVPLSYYERAIEWLTDQPEVQSAGVGVSGLSLGGVAAQLIATRDDRVDAVVATSSSPVPFKGETTDGESPFAHEVEPVPAVYATYDDAERRDGKLYSRPVFETALERASDEEIEEAWIPHEEASADFLFVTGEADALWPATELADRAIARLDEVGYEHDYEHLSYEDAGHIITVPHGVTTQDTESPNRLLGGTPSGLAAAETDSWQRIRDFLGNVG